MDQVAGLTGDPMYFSIAPLNRDFWYNISLIPKRMGRSMDPLTLDESQLAVQRNECSFILNVYSTPTVGENLTQGPVVDENILQMMSFYTVDSRDKENDDILVSFQSFHPLVVFFILLFACVLASMIFISDGIGIKRIKYRRRQKKISLSFIILLVYTQFVSVGYQFRRINCLSLKLLWCCLIALGFYSSYYYSAMIHTDMVTVKHPLVVQSYRDIIDCKDQRFKVFFLSIFDSQTSFKEADPKSDKYKIWQHLDPEMGIIEADMENGPRVMTMLMSGKYVLIEFSDVMHLAQYSTYLVAKSAGMRTIIKSDPSEKPIIRTYVFNKNLDQRIQRIVNTRTSRGRQAGIVAENLKKAGKLVLVFVNNELKRDNGYLDMDEYLSDKIILPEPEIIRPDAVYFQGIFITLAVGVLVSTLVLICEHVLKEYSHY